MAATSTHDAAPVDFFTWNRDFHGIRPAGTTDKRPERLTHGVARVAIAIAAYVNSKTGEAHPGYKRIAEAAQVSEATVANAIPVLESAGWIEVNRSKKSGSNADAVNSYRLTSPVAAIRSAEGTPTIGVGVPQQLGQGTPVVGDELRSLTTSTTTKEKIHSVGASFDRVEEHSVEASVNRDPKIPLPLNWKPNKFHRSSADKQNVDIDDALEDFKDRTLGRISDGWDAAFGEFINSTALGTVDATFPYRLRSVS